MVLKTLTKTKKSDRLIVGETEWVDVKDCVPYSKAFPKQGKYVKGYDRKLEMVNKIKGYFKPHLFGRPIVTRIEHSKYKYVIIDGNNRISALKQLKKQPTIIEVQIIKTKSIHDEVQAFLDVNHESRRLSFKEQFRARLHREEREAEAIHLLLKKFGISVKDVDEKLTDKVLTSLWDFQQAYRKNPKATETFVEVMIKAFSEYFDDDAQETYIFSSRNIRAGTTFFRDNPEAKPERMIEKLQKLTNHAIKNKRVRKYTPNKLQSKVERWYSLDNSNGATAYHKIYNEDLGGSYKLKYKGGHIKS